MTDVPEPVDQADDEAAAKRERMREFGRRGGIVSGRSRRRKPTLREELLEAARGSRNAAGIAAVLKQLPPEREVELHSDPDKSASFVDVLRTLHEAAALEPMLVEAGVLEPEHPEPEHPSGASGGHRETGGGWLRIGSPRGGGAVAVPVSSEWLRVPGQAEAVSFSGGPQRLRGLWQARAELVLIRVVAACFGHGLSHRLIIELDLSELGVGDVGVGIEIL